MSEREEDIIRMKAELEKLVSQEVARRRNSWLLLSPWFGGPAISKQSIREKVVRLMRLAIAEIH